MNRKMETTFALLRQVIVTDTLPVKEIHDLWRALGMESQVKLQYCFYTNLTCFNILVILSKIMILCSKLVITSKHCPLLSVYSKCRCR